MKKLIVLLSLLPAPAFSLVSGPSSLNPDDQIVAVETISETGVVEPHADRSSYQNANIQIMKLSWTKGFSDFWVFQDGSFKFDAGTLTSAQEVAKGAVVYEADRGSFAGFEFNGNLVHDAYRIVGIVLRVHPHVKMNEEKFSNPRIDTVGIGLNTIVALTPRFFVRNFLYQGSGLGPQNPSMAVNTAVGYRLDDFVGRPVTIGTGYFLEADLRDRFDAKYDAAYSDPGERDRVRSMKYGVVSTVEAEPIRGVLIGGQYLEKQGGYDARATKVLSLSFGLRF